MFGVAGVKGYEFAFFVAPFDTAALCVFFFKVKPEAACFTRLIFNPIVQGIFEPHFLFLGHEV